VYWAQVRQPGRRRPTRPWPVRKLAQACQTVMMVHIILFCKWGCQGWRTRGGWDGVFEWNSVEIWS